MSSRQSTQRLPTSLIITLIFSLALFFNVVFTHAEPAQPNNNTDILTPYTANYTANHSSLPISGSAQRTLSKLKNGNYQLKQTASALVATITETSEFQLVDGNIQPQNYQYNRSSFSKQKSTEMTFNWAAKQVTGIHKKEAFHLALDAGRQDSLSYQLVLRKKLKQLMAGELAHDSIIIPLVDKDELETHTYAVLGAETIKTPAGDFECLKLKRIRKDGKRETTIWFAKAHQLLITKILQKGKDGKTYELALKDFKFSNN